MDGVSYPQNIERGIRYVFDLFQDDGQDRWVQAGVGHPHHKEECTVDVMDRDDHLYVPSCMVYDGHLLLVDVRCHVWAVVVHQRTIPETQKGQGLTLTFYFVLFHGLIDCPIDETIHGFTPRFSMFPDQILVPLGYGQVDSVICLGNVVILPLGLPLFLHIDHLPFWKYYTSIHIIAQRIKMYKYVAQCLFIRSIETRCAT